MNTFEKKGMLFSFWGALFFGVLGISFSVWTKSQAVLLDGAFNLISAATVFAAMKIGVLLGKPETSAQPAGYAALEPFYVAVRGVIVLSLSVFVVISNIVIALNGGNELQLGVIVIYLGIAVAGNLVIFLFVRRAATKAGSPMLDVERQNWMVNTLITTAIAVSFLIVLVFKDSFISPIIPYADQIVVILVGLLTLNVPLEAIKSGLKELLLLGTDTTSKKAIDDIMADNITEEVSSWKTFMLKTGRKYWISVFVSPKKDQINADFGDLIKESLTPSITETFPVHNLDVIITKAVN